MFTLILNGFRELYLPMACIYFQAGEARLSSQAFYHELEQAAHQKDPAKAEEITRVVMLDSLRMWELVQKDSFRSQDKEIGSMR